MIFKTISNIIEHYKIQFNNKISIPVSFISFKFERKLYLNWKSNRNKNFRTQVNQVSFLLYPTEFNMNSCSIDNLFGTITNQVLDWKCKQQMALLFYDFEWNAREPSIFLLNISGYCFIDFIYFDSESSNGHEFDKIDV